MYSEEATRRWKKRHPERVEQYRLRSYARQLERGEQIQSWAHHHKGMALLKAQLGDPRPSGMTLSLLHFDSLGCYWGYEQRKGERRPYRLSIDPADYVWESRGDNNRRKMADHPTEENV
jgi:hypothetical protein